jgi:hypothetical protein
MNLLDIRKEFIRHTGRFDLVTNTSTFADNGANFFIKAGQRVLDNKVNIFQNDMILNMQTTVGDDLLRISGIRTIEGVWIVYDGVSRLLIEAFLHDFKQAFADNVSTGMPTHYVIIPLRQSMNEDEDVLEHGFLLGPKPSQEFDIRIKGRFFSHPLVQDTDKNFWSIQYPHTLIQAALYSIERFYRNTQGMNDHMLAIEEDLRGIDHEQVEQESRLRTNMADSFNENIFNRYRPHGL